MLCDKAIDEIIEEASLLSEHSTMSIEEAINQVISKHKQTLVERNDNNAEQNHRRAIKRIGRCAIV